MVTYLRAMGNSKGIVKRLEIGTIDAAKIDIIYKHIEIRNNTNNIN